MWERRERRERGKRGKRGERRIFNSSNYEL
jgi:hypothetical protein